MELHAAHAGGVHADSVGARVGLNSTSRPL